MWLNFYQEADFRDFPSSPNAPNAWGLGSIPGQGTRSCMPHLRPSADKQIDTSK